MPAAQRNDERPSGSTSHQVRVVYFSREPVPSHTRLKQSSMPLCCMMTFGRVLCTGMNKLDGNVCSSSTQAHAAITLHMQQHFRGGLWSWKSIQHNRLQIATMVQCVHPHPDKFSLSFPYLLPLVQANCPLGTILECKESAELIYMALLSYIAVQPASESISLLSL